MIIFMLMFDTGELSCPDLQCFLKIIYLHFEIFKIFFKILPFHIHNKYLSSSSRVAGGQSKQPGPICNCGRRNIGQQLYDPWPGGVTWPVVSDGVIITPSIPRPPAQLLLAFRQASKHRN